jgi:lipoprotein signal peptidase
MGTKHAVFFPVALLTLGVDQLLKRHVTQAMEVGGRMPLVGDALALTHVPSGAGAFGIFRDWLPGAQLIGFSTLAVCATLAIIGYYRAIAPGEQGNAAGLGAMLGGIMSHAFDRLRYGSGLDSIHVGPIRSDAVPDFSLADVAIVLGAATLVVELLATEMAGRAAERPRR